jgi:hypothetical protein
MTRDHKVAHLGYNLESFPSSPLPRIRQFDFKTNVTLLMQDFF